VPNLRPTKVPENFSPSVRLVGLDKGYAPLMTYGSEVVRQQLFLTDNKEFSPFDVPPGKYQIKVWQETLGTQTQEATVATGKTKTTARRITF
jgi:hypothetical protein